jgi:hypothetical protein
MTSNAHQVVGSSQPIGDWPGAGWPYPPNNIGNWQWPMGGAWPVPATPALSWPISIPSCSFPPSCPYCCKSRDTWARNGGYCCDADHHDRHRAALSHAAAFLRLHGYTVTEPAEKPSDGEGEVEGGSGSDGPRPA